MVKLSNQTYMLMAEQDLLFWQEFLIKRPEVVNVLACVDKYPIYMKEELFNQLQFDIKSGKYAFEHLIKCYDPKFNYDKRRGLLDCYNEGLNDEQIKICSNLDFTRGQIKEIRIGFKNGLSIEQVLIYAQEYYPEYKMECIRDALERGLSITKVKTFARNAFTIEQMECVKEGLFNNFTLKQVNLYSSPEFNHEQMRVIMSFIPKLTYDQIELFAKPEFSTGQMQTLGEAIFCNKVKQDKIHLLLNPNLSAKHMEELITLIHRRCSMDKLRLYAQLDMDKMRRKVVKECIEIGIDLASIKLLVGDNKRTYADMNLILEAFKRKYKTEQIRILTSCNGGNQVMEEIDRGIRNGLSDEKLRIMATPGLVSNQVREIYIGFAHDLSVKQVNLYAKKEYDSKFMKIIRECLDADVPEGVIEFCISQKFDEHQIEEVKQGFIDKLTLEQVMAYAKSNLKSDQMRAIRNAILSGLTMEQIGVLANEEFSSYQMEELTEVYLTNLTDEQIKFIANKSFSAEKMKQIKIAYLLGMPEDKIKSFEHSRIATTKIEYEIAIFGAKKLKEIVCKN